MQDLAYRTVGSRERTLVKRTECTVKTDSDWEMHCVTARRRSPDGRSIATVAEASACESRCGKRSGNASSLILSPVSICYAQARAIATFMPHSCAAKIIRQSSTLFIKIAASTTGLLRSLQQACPYSVHVLWFQPFDTNPYHDAGLLPH